MFKLHSVSLSINKCDDNDDDDDDDNQSIIQSASLAQVDIYNLHTANESVDDDQSKMHYITLH